MTFSRPTLAELIQRNTTNLNSRLTGTDAALRRANTNALAKMNAGGIHGLYGYLEYIAQQVIYDTAEAEYLERWASIWDIYRKAAEYASGSVTFTGASGSVIPAGTEMQRADETIYTLDDDVTLVDGSGSGAVTASEAGSDGNAIAGVSLSLISVIEGVETSATVGSAGITGGFDQEEDSDLLTRFLRRLRNPPQGGAKHDYEDWALEVSGVTRAWCFPLQSGAGTVGVTFVCDNQDGSIIPTETTVAAVAAQIDLKRPVTPKAVNVYAPTPVPLDLTIAATPNTSAVQTAIAAELADLIAREAIPGGTIILTHIREAISIASGETDHNLVSPTADVTHTEQQVAVLGTITWQ